jgi:hypothetical protein
MGLIIAASIGICYIYPCHILLISAEYSAVNKSRVNDKDED